MIILRTPDISIRTRLKIRLAFFRLRSMLRPLLIVSNPGYDELSEAEKRAADEWAEGLREGVAEALGVPVGMIREIPKSWKYAWITGWKEAFVSPKEKGIEMAKEVI